MESLRWSITQLFQLGNLSAQLATLELCFVEPSLILPPVSPEDPRIMIGIANEKGVIARCDRWSNRDEMTQYFSLRHPWREWDASIFQKYIDHAFKVVTAENGKTYMTPKLDKNEEPPLYLAQGHSMHGSEVADICAQIPVHLIFGEYAKLLSPDAKAQMYNTSKGRNVASIRTIKGAGHLIPQEKPLEMAVVFYDILSLFMPPLKAGL